MWCSHHTGAAIKVSLSPARFYQPYAYSISLQLILQGLGQTLHRVFRRVIRREKRKSHSSAERRHVDDDAAPGLAHQGQDELNHSNNAHEVRVDLTPQILRRCAFEGP